METSGVWILIMNATRARILRGIDHRRSVPSELVLRSRQRRLRSVLGNGTYGGPHISGHAYPASHGVWNDMLVQDENDFSQQVVAFLESHRLARDFDRLVVFGAPEVLARLREAMPATLRGRVAAEIDQNLIRLSEAELEERVATVVEAL
ncbi:host attachment protein [Solirhodobacter olei]|uniref:host attachment protein n=1 Tax=Solirhodobacter olei TaxID=2493082 RepID=UPI000FDC2C32|nr:host attachment protein [Solirhodobacter olei]